MAWSVRSSCVLRRLCPELDRFESDEDANRAWAEAGGRSITARRFFLCAGSVVLLFTLAALGLLLFRLDSFSIWLFLACTLSTLGLVNGVGRRTRVQLRRVLREQLVKRGVPICIECGYDLRGLPEPRCPECGARSDVAGETPEKQTSGGSQ